jgi:hypothetical protein
MRSCSQCTWHLCRWKEKKKSVKVPIADAADLLLEFAFSPAEIIKEQELVPSLILHANHRSHHIRVPRDNMHAKMLRASSIVLLIHFMYK